MSSIMIATGRVTSSVSAARAAQRKRTRALL
jgi:hypothetical protein